MNDMVPKRGGGVGPWLGEWIASGKLPGAVKAIAHVVGATGNAIAAGVDIGKAKAEQISQGIKDETEARSIMKAALARQAVDMLPEHKEFAHRAMNRWFSEELKKQENREAVAQLAAKELHDNPPEDSNAAPNENWLNVFGEYAEKASSEKVREYWSQVLNGEIRKSGSFSPNAMRVLASLDADIMFNFEHLCTIVISDKLIFRINEFSNGAGLEAIHDMEAYGLVQGTPMMTTTHEIKSGSPTFFGFRHYVVKIECKKDFILIADAIFLTRAGASISKIIEVPDSDIYVKKCIKYLSDKILDKATITVFKFDNTDLVQITLD